MKRLYHYPLDAFSRQIRIYLKEKHIDHSLFVRFPWSGPNEEDDENDLSLPCDLPILLDGSNVYKGWYAIVEHLEQQDSSLFGSTEATKSEARRIASLFNCFFFAEVTRNIVFEKVIKRYIENSSPDSSAIRKGNNAISKYFEYINWLTDRRNWLAGEDFTFADIAAAAQISSLDYIGNVEWEKYPMVKNWYVRIKSRPSFRDLLSDHISNITPPPHYKDLDF